MAIHERRTNLMRKQTMYLLFGLLALVLVAGLVYLLKSRLAKTPAAGENNNPPSQQAAAKPIVATIETSMGNFDVTLDPAAAPQTVANFVKLAKEGFYDHLKFHRAVKG